MTKINDLIAAKRLVLPGEFADLACFLLKDKKPLYYPKIYYY
jgi:hypothetical protein